MAEQPEQSNPFSSGHDYEFKPPITTKAMRVAQNQSWEGEKTFAEGWYLRFDPTRNAHRFQGKPVDGDGQYYFYFTEGCGSAATPVATKVESPEPVAPE